MSDEKSEDTFIRFVMPFALIVIGITTLAFTPGVGVLSLVVVQTIGFGMFTAGAFSFMIIYNHARNPLATDEVIVSVAQGLVVYGGLLAALLHQQILSLGSVVLAVCVVFVIGFVVSGVVEFKSPQPSNI